LKLENLRNELKPFIKEVKSAQNLKNIDTLHTEMRDIAENELKGSLTYFSSNRLHPRNWTFYKLLKLDIDELKRYYNDVDQLIESVYLFKEQILQRVADILEENITPGASISVDSLPELIGLNDKTTLEILEFLEKEKKLPGKYVRKDNKFIRQYKPPIPYSKLKNIPDKDKLKLLEILRKKVDYAQIGDVLFFLQFKSRLAFEHFLLSNDINDIKLTKEHVIILENPINEVSH
jgi:hypothetical protein